MVETSGYLVNIKAGRSIKLLSPSLIEAVFRHPAHRANPPRIAELIGWLRVCEHPVDFNAFQRHLFGDVYRAEERRAQCSRIIKRLKRGERLPKDTPPPPPDGDPTLLETWELEAFVYERIARQLRTVGDGLAWRCFGYDRRVILTLARNAPAGPMYGKDGLPYELGRIEELWSQEGHFALHHDLTNCIRIADLTEFTDGGGALFREIKRSLRTRRSQVERAQAAVDAIANGGPLPGDRPDARLVELAVPYKTNLKQLNDLVQRAKYHGCRGMKLSQGRALIATSLPRALDRWGSDHEEAERAIDSIRQRALKRAGIADAMHHILGLSGDTASRSPIMAPWSIYPLSPIDCAAIICDLLLFETIISAKEIADSLNRAGLGTDLLLQPMSSEIKGDMKIIQAHLGARALTLHAEGLNILLYELVEPDTWARGVREVLESDYPPAEPVFVFAQEGDTWRPV